MFNVYFNYIFYTFGTIMKRQVISLFFLFIISFQAFPIKSYFNDGEIEISQDISEDEVEKSEAKSKKIETCHSFFLDHLDISYTSTAIFILNVKMGQLAQGYSTSTFIPPNFS